MKTSHSLVALTVLAFVAACGNGAVPGSAGSSPTTASASASASRTSTAPSTTLNTTKLNTTTAASMTSSTGLPRFATPQEAGRYLAQKWNAKDDAALHHITNDESRFALADMSTFASRDLTLDQCTKNDDLTYTCEFTHGFLPGKDQPGSVPTEDGHDGPAATDDPHHGRTALKAVAVDRTGWYFNVFLYCG
ncbi:MAG: hypothetical protein JWM93_1537 [Frankiales bacterium]|nr:hypothetical protein [Frankiales bacterium]